LAGRIDLLYKVQHYQIETYEAITGKQQLYNLLMEADNDIENGNFLTEEEIDNFLDSI
jgi:hypothetical protein